MQRFGEKVRALRQQRGMTVRELAEALGYSGHSHISEIETGKREPRVGFILKVAEFFNVSMVACGKSSSGEAGAALW